MVTTNEERIANQRLLEMLALGILLSSKDDRKRVESSDFSNTAFGDCLAELRAAKSEYKALRKMLAECGVEWRDGKPLDAIFKTLRNNALRSLLEKKIRKVQAILSMGMSMRDAELFFASVKDAAMEIQELEVKT